MNPEFYPDTYLHLKNFLTQEQVKFIKQHLSQMRFVDGKASASGIAKKVKNNQQVETGSDQNSQFLQSMVLQAIYENPMIQGQIMPKAVYPPIFSKYEVGQTYGWHMDGPIMGQQPPVRTDAAITIFLNDPETYEGGELMVKSQAGEVKYKLPAGDAVVYPATQLHQVAPVTQGERLAAVTWIQSLIGDTFKREILSNINNVYLSLTEKGIDQEDASALSHAYSNLMRLWAEM